MDGLGAAHQSDVWQARLIAVPPDRATAPAAGLSVILVTYNSAAHLAASLASIHGACDSLPWECIVVDNASNDFSVALVHELLPAATVIENSKNRGFAFAANQGASHSHHEWLFFLNPDLILDEQALSQLITFANSKPDGALFVPRLRLSDGSFHPTCREFPTLGNLLGARGSILRFIFSRGSQSYTVGDSPSPQVVPAVAGTGVLISRRIFESLGGFDERYFLYMEDTDLSRRSAIAGYTNWFVPQAGGVHYWQEGSRESDWRREWRHHVALIHYFQKHQPGIVSSLFLPLLILVHFLIAALLSVFGHVRTNSRTQRPAQESPTHE